MFGDRLLSLTQKGSRWDSCHRVCLRGSYSLDLCKVLSCRDKTQTFLLQWWKKNWRSQDHQENLVLQRLFWKDKKQPAFGEELTTCLSTRQFRELQTPCNLVIPVAKYVYTKKKKQQVEERRVGFLASTSWIYYKLCI